MNNELLSAIDNSEKQELAKSFTEYKKLLLEGNPTPTNVKRLRDLLTKLNMTAVEARADLGRLGRFSELEKVVELGQGMSSPYEEKREEMKAQKARAHQVRLALDDEERKLFYEGVALSQKLGAAESALREMTELKSAWPSLFSDRSLPELKP